MPFPLGLASWLVIGLIAGISADRMLPGPKPLGVLFGSWAGILGSVAAGMLATVLGFGGLVGYDVRALAVATVGSVITLLLSHLARQPAAPPAE